MVRPTVALMPCPHCPSRFYRFSPMNFGQRRSLNRPWWTSAAVGERRRRFFILCFVLHGDLALWIDTGLRDMELSGKTKVGGIRFYSQQCAGAMMWRCSSSTFLLLWNPFIIHCKWLSVWVCFIHPGLCLNAVAGRRAGVTADTCEPILCGADLPGLFSYCPWCLQQRKPQSWSS